LEFICEHFSASPDFSVIGACRGLLHARRVFCGKAGFTLTLAATGFAVFEGWEFMHPYLSG